MADDLTLQIGGVNISGWTSTRVTCGVERCPSSFELELTDRFPGQQSKVQAQPGDACVVLLGSDVVVTGYVDVLAPFYSPSGHGLRLSGRGKCEDLVDCSAEWPGGQISGTSALDIATKLAQPYGITVSAPDGEGPSIPQFNLMLGETAYQIIERVCRAAGLLCYEDASGNLVLAQSGSETHASGIEEGANILEAHAEYSFAERYSEYDVFMLNMDVLTDTGDGGNLVATSTDGSIKRHRKLYVLADEGIIGLGLAQTRADWEASRRWGRGAQLYVTVDSWRDAAGKLWAPNVQIPVNAPNLKWTRGPNAMITEVTYTKDEQGTRADLHLMPPEAFLPEPVVLQPSVNDVRPPGQ